MAKLNPASTKGFINNLFNLKSFNSLKKDQTNIKIFKDSSFDSSFNSVQSLNTNLSNIQLQPSNNSTLVAGLVVLKRGGLSLGSCVSCVAGGVVARAEAIENKQFLAPADVEQPQLSPAPADPKDPIPATAYLQGSRNNKNIKNPKFIAILRAIRSIRLNRDEWRLIRIINLMEKKNRRSPFFGSFSPDLTEKLIGGDTPAYKLGGDQIINNKIISKNILLRNTNRYKNLKSILSSILKKKIRSISEVLEDKPIKNYILYSYLKNCISLIPPHLNGGKTKLSLNKYKGRKYGSFIKYNKIIGYKFNSTFYQSAILNPNGYATPVTLSDPNSVSISLQKEIYSSYAGSAVGVGGPNIYIKDTYKLLFYLFKSMYCLISKPVLNYTNDKVTIQLFYYLNIPKKKIFRLFSIFYINSIKKKWLALIEKKKTNLNYSAPQSSHSLALQPHSSSSFPAEVGGEPQIYINWKLRKAISRFKNKNITVTSLPQAGSSIVASSLVQRLADLDTPAPATQEQDPQEGGKNILFKLRKFNLTAKEVYQNKFKLICAILSNKFNKPVELQLIRLHHPYHDSNILVNLLSLNIKNKRKKARVAVLAKKIYNKKPVKFLNDSNLNKETANFIPAFLSGLNIKIAGRLMGEPIIPRITTKIFGKGANATGKVNYLDVARITKKNRKGAYTIKITSGQNFF